MKSDTSDTFKVRIGHLRRRGGFRSNGELATFIGISRSRLQDFLRPENPVPPTSKVLAKLSDAERRIGQGDYPTNDGSSQMAVGESPRFVETNRPLVRPTDDVQLSKAFGSSHREPTEEDCLRYLQDYLAEAKQVPGLVGHTLIELRKRFPIDEARRLSEDDRVQKKGT